MSSLDAGRWSRALAVALVVSLVTAPVALLIGYGVTRIQYQRLIEHAIQDLKTIVGHCTGGAADKACVQKSVDDHFNGQREDAPSGAYLVQITIADGNGTAIAEGGYAILAASDQVRTVIASCRDAYADLLAIRPPAYYCIRATGSPLALSSEGRVADVRGALAMAGQPLRQVVGLAIILVGAVFGLCFALVAARPTVLDRARQRLVEGVPGLLAWWYGLSPTARGQPVSGAPLPSPEPAADRLTDGRPPPGNNRWNRPLWSATRLEVAQKLWGMGKIIPLDEKRAIELLIPLGLTAAANILEIGAGLGAFGHVISKKYGAWTTGLEESPILLKEGNKYLRSICNDKKVTLSAFDREHFQYSERRVDVVLSYFSFFTIHDKRTLFREIDQCLKPGGQLLFTDFVVEAGARDREPILYWAYREPLEPCPLTLTEIQTLLGETELELRVIDDITEMFFAQVFKGLWDFLPFLETVMPSSDTKPHIYEEAELWARREAAIRSGLRCYRFHAFKKAVRK